MTDDAEKKIENGLADVLGLPNAYQQSPFGQPVSQTDTLFANLRYYLVSNMRQVLSQAYVEIGLIQTIVDVPVDDAMRGGVEIKSDQLDEKQIIDLVNALEREDDLTNIGQSAKWNRLFGGAGILILTDQDPTEPLDTNAIGENTPLEFRAVDLWELYGDRQFSQGFSFEFEDDQSEYFNYYGEKVHKSRLLLLRGMPAPSFVRPRMRGWGVSVVETLVRSINQYLKSSALSFEVLDEFKLDIYKIKNFTQSLMDPNAQAKVTQRIQIGNMQKSFQNALVMDKEDDYDHKQLSFAGLAEAMGQIRMQVASDMRMPLTKLFGISAAGFNSGEDDIEVYNAMVESQIRSKIKFHALKVIEIRCQKMFGMIPDDLKISFKALRVLSSVEEEQVKTQKFARLKEARSANEITAEEFRDACNKGGLFDINLDNSNAVLKELEEQKAAAMPQVAGGEGKPKDDENAPEAKETKEAKEKPTPVKNSSEFDRASYEADGGDSWINPARKELFEDPVHVDAGLWQKAKEKSQETFGKYVWQFAAWTYQKLSGEKL